MKTIRDIYIAGKFEAKWRLKIIRDLIHYGSAGRVISTWLEEEPAPYGGVTPAMAYQFAVRDREEVLDSDLLILDTHDDNYRGGREVEFGIALGRGIEVWVVGPKRNVFHEMACHFESWSDALETLRKIAREEVGA